MQAANWPNFIFPFSPSQDFSIDNFTYRTRPTSSTGLSVAYQPVYHGQDVTIRLKGNYR